MLKRQHLAVRNNIQRYPHSPIYKQIMRQFFNKSVKKTLKLKLSYNNELLSEFATVVIEIVKSIISALQHTYTLLHKCIDIIPS